VQQYGPRRFQSKGHENLASIMLRNYLIKLSHHVIREDQPWGERKLVSLEKVCPRRAVGANRTTSRPCRRSQRHRLVHFRLELSRAIHQRRDLAHQASGNLSNRPRLALDARCHQIDDCLLKPARAPVSSTRADGHANTLRMGSDKHR
jgi:hypothetical protein